MLTPSLRRVYTSRAFLIAISASGACRLPTCLCASPCCERMKISHNGHSRLMALSVSRHPRVWRSALFRIRNRGLTHPRTVFPCRHARAHPIAVARSVAFEDVVELAPIDRTEIVVFARRAPLEIRIGHRDTEKIGLRNRLVDEALPELVVR